MKPGKTVLPPASSSSAPGPTASRTSRSSPTAPMPTPLILDVDTGVDDMVALLFAVASPEVDLIGATCVTGNVHVDMVTRNTSLVLELAGAGGVEIARGAPEPLDGGWQPFPVV